MGTVFRISRERITPAPGTLVMPAADAAVFVQAQALLDAAAARAQALEAETALCCERLKEEAFQEGLDRGRMEQAEKIMETVLGTVEYMESVEQQLVSVVIQAIRKIVGDLPEDERIVRTVRQALRDTRSQQRVMLRVAPGDEVPLREALASLFASTAGTSSFLELVTDGRLARGSCLLESELGVVDASLEVQLQAVENAFKEKVHR